MLYYSKHECLMTVSELAQNMSDMKYTKDVCSVKKHKIKEDFYEVDFLN